MRRRILKAAGIFVLLAALGIGCLFGTSLSYPYCLVLEPLWVNAKTRVELENRLFAFYRCEAIDPAHTVWREDPPPDGQTILRYLIFNKERLDVIVADDGTITDLFAAYE